MGKQTVKGLIVQMLNFYGPFDFVRMGFRFAATRIKAKALRFGAKCTIGQLAEEHGIPVTYVASLNGALLPALGESSLPGAWLVLPDFQELACFPDQDSVGHDRTYGEFDKVNSVIFGQPRRYG